MALRFLLLGAALAWVSGCARCPEPSSPTQSGWAPPAPAPYGSTAPAPAPPPRAPLEVHQGKAVYYGDSLAGNHTANGEIYDPRKLTAASRSLPFGTMVRVVRLDTGREVVVRINDRGPFGNERRIIDLSRAAAEQLDMIRAGVVDVRVEVLAFGG